MARHTDTIAALASPAGTAALAILRISGPNTIGIASAALGSPPPPRLATYADYSDLGGMVVDDVVATLYSGPNSYTGEDSLEITCHGSPFIARKILSDLLARGCRPAGPGEFTLRAFLNGKMDLSQSEAVMDLINARSDRALSAARQVLRGALGRHLAVMVDGVIAALSRVEAYIDFPDEDLPPEDRSGLERRVAAVLKGAEQLLATERTGVLLREGIVTVMVGETNAGKSSLLNRLVGAERAIVSEEAGTTRDFIEERINVGAHGLRLVDTAGLNSEAAGVERQGVGKTLEMAARADLFLVVVDAVGPSPSLPPVVLSRITPSNTIWVLNKIDLLTGSALPVAAPLPGYPSVSVSARTGKGLEALRGALERQAEGLQLTLGEERIAINVRHAHFLAQARADLEAALTKIRDFGPAELVASDLRGALGAFGEISGKVDNERMLDQLFVSFCIGK